MAILSTLLIIFGGIAAVGIFVSLIGKWTGTTETLNAIMNFFGHAFNSLLKTFQFAPRFVQIGIFVMIGVVLFGLLIPMVLTAGRVCSEGTLYGTDFFTSLLLKSANDQPDGYGDWMDAAKVEQGTMLGTTSSLSGGFADDGFVRELGTDVTISSEWIAGSQTMTSFFGASYTTHENINGILSNIIYNPNNRGWVDLDGKNNLLVKTLKYVVVLDTDPRNPSDNAFCQLRYYGVDSSGSVLATVVDSPLSGNDVPFDFDKFRSTGKCNGFSSDHTCSNNAELIGQIWVHVFADYKPGVGDRFDTFAVIESQMNTNSAIGKATSSSTYPCPETEDDAGNLLYFQKLTVPANYVGTGMNDFGDVEFLYLQIDQGNEFKNGADRTGKISQRASAISKLKSGGEPLETLSQGSGDFITYQCTDESGVVSAKGANVKPYLKNVDVFNVQMLFVVVIGTGLLMMLRWFQR